MYGAVDFAGGLVVHTSSGVAAFVLAFWLGRRADAASASEAASNVPFVILGTALLWFGAWGGRLHPTWAQALLVSCLAWRRLVWLQRRQCPGRKLRRGAVLYKHTGAFARLTLLPVRGRDSPPPPSNTLLQAAAAVAMVAWCAFEIVFPAPTPPPRASLSSSDDPAAAAAAAGASGGGAGAEAGGKARVAGAAGSIVTESSLVTAGLELQQLQHAPPQRSGSGGGGQLPMDASGPPPLVLHIPSGGPADVARAPSAAAAAARRASVSKHNGRLKVRGLLPTCALDLPPVPSRITPSGLSPAAAAL